jgi:hypothetical protein
VKSLVELGKGGCETGDFKIKTNGFQPATILRRRVFTRDEL